MVIVECSERLKGMEISTNESLESKMICFHKLISSGCERQSQIPDKKYCAKKVTCFYSFAEKINMGKPNFRFFLFFEDSNYII